MKTFLEHVNDLLLEKIITLGKKLYPKSGNVVIMAGGAGSGKGFVLSNLIGVDGKVFDVDELKKVSMRAKALGKKVKDQFGVDLNELDLKNPDDVSTLHEIIGDTFDLPDKKLRAFMASVMTASPEDKPNIIFDVTLKDLRKLEKITRQVGAMGYDKKNVHIVWVVNDIEVALQQNKKRDRTVRPEILINTHRGAANTMKDILNMGNSLKSYMDGDIVFAFNKINVDSEVVKSGKGGKFVKDADYVHVKKQGKPPMKVNELEVSMRRKITSYVPDEISWI